MRLIPSAALAALITLTGPALADSCAQPHYKDGNLVCDFNDRINQRMEEIRRKREHEARHEHHHKHPRVILRYQDDDPPVRHPHYRQHDRDDDYEDDYDSSRHHHHSGYPDDYDPDGDY